ncbi:MAG TPA: protein kinase [Streptosporangiaceae bacterium]|nr:protein kinase [Streptosporangiaceae bacterium]
MGEDGPGGGRAVLSAGSRVGGYLLEEEIGAGGMAVVFRARDERLERPVALKVLAPWLAADEGFRHRFLGESRAAAAVDDPHIIPVYEAGEAGEVLFIAMRFVSGGDVRELLHREGALAAPRAAAILSPVAVALDAAHAAGLVHRDVKPANMLLDSRPGRLDHVYLSDFGLSRRGSSSGLTGAGVRLGTVAYMAPEQIEGRVLDGRADQYALACAAFELLAGVVPFDRDQDMAVIYAHMSAPPPSLSAARPGLPPAADAVLARAMAKAPGGRYPSCRDFAEALREAFGLARYDDSGAPAQAAPPAVMATRQAAGARATRPLPGGERDLPTGVVTMLFTDIEGSTLLLARLGEQYGQALSAQRTIMRSAIREHHGLEMGTEGDSFYVVFRSAADAVGCCVAAQRALGEYEWPGGAAVRVRMGLHAGQPVRHEEAYVGMDVHRAARIAAAAHGGQVVLSEAAWQLAQPEAPPGVGVRDLGFHRLKDIEEPERIVQLTAPGLADGFPPLKSLGAPTSLPTPATPLVGREADLAYLLAELTGPQVRLVTLTGPGGVGKTRLAIAAAASLDHLFPHGVYFVALAAVADPAVMWKTIAGDLDVEGDDAAAVTGHLRDRRLLLVLDNLEQLPGAAGVIAELVDSAPHLVVLATSRGPLHLPGEHAVPVPPLPVPPDEAGAGDVAASASVRLFARQAAMVRPGFEVTEGNAADVAAICRRLDGLPLAIELAAARGRLLAPKALLARLGSSLPLGASGAGRPSRQQTLRATIAWSYDLLEPDVAAVFRRAGAFAGGCDLDALAAVATADVGDPPDPLEHLAALLDVSLITVTEDADGEPRAGLLEMIREYALERLAEAGELEETRLRHARHFTEFAEREREKLNTLEHLAALDRLETEHDNLRAALAWSLEARPADPAAPGERTAIGLRLVQALIGFWYHHGHAAEGRRWLERALELACEEAGAPLARVAHGLGILLGEQGDPAAARPFLERSLAIWRELGDREQQSRELNSLGITYHHLSAWDASRSAFEESIAIARELGSEVRLAVALSNLGQLESAAGDFDRAAHVLQEALAIDQVKGDVFGVAIDQQSLAMVSLRAGRPQEASETLSGILDYVISCGDPDFLANVLELSACVAAELGDGLRAARLVGAAEALRQKTGLRMAPTDLVLLERFTGPARAGLGRDTWDAELAVGRALTQEQTAALLGSAAKPST